MTIAVMVAGVVSLALVGRMVDSTTELVRLLRAPRAPTAAVDSTLDASFDDGQSIDAAPSVSPIVEDVRLSVVPILERPERPFANVATSDAGTPDAPVDGSERDGAVADSGAPPDVTDVAAAVARTEAKDAAAATLAAAARPQSARCGWLTCPEGQVCCNWNCAICVKPGETCSSACGAPGAPLSAMCGPRTCNVGEMCCNESCGTCVPLGGSCSKEPCASMYIPQSEPCGMSTCNVGQVCCNPSCGICTLPGETCSHAPCL
ncbi:MAG: hypothetical protein ABW133_08390 [Polyangiaceae bacterium]